MSASACTRSVTDYYYLMMIVWVLMVKHNYPVTVNYNILICCSFCCSIIRNFDGTLVIKYQHPEAVYGCDWSPHNAYVSTEVFASYVMFVM